ncbi:tRNA epoxyqueuosine(34) reductase QueG [Pseudobdellovibrio exovorus]|uniref:Iron-sulfur cluster-binding protein n=1 Tax=Pseudobdellovibrio exovorus JSS TaxID=1184267 RepID=M4V7U2_9BACT|nr:tRNA epoxyqueuosine(34) reductase QueG [Pseudobdellovibrio exovorus]AGH95293.1 iron-sulfur cluster-binding protein [Pseudobdellovibrio exovorus JSS]
MTDFQDSLNDSLSSRLKSAALSLGFSQAAISPLKSPLSIAFYEKWLSQGHHADMAYLQNHLPFKQDPTLLGKELKSVISVTHSYYPAVQPSPLTVPARTALYSQNEDYHFWVKEKLQKLSSELSQLYPDSVFLPYVDSGPILERDLAYQNGLGWFGKNTCLIHPQHGSLFFIAEILTTLAIKNESLDGSPAEGSPIEPLPDFCGKCQKCLDICPTGALSSPRVLEADKCISYLTIESKSVPALELRNKIGDWFFGCDLCQTTCPWNQKVFRKSNIDHGNRTSTDLHSNLTAERRTELIEYFQFLLQASHKQIQKHHYGSPLLRAGAKGLKRNALIVIANQQLHELTEVVKALQTPELVELKEWTLEQLTS